VARSHRLASAETWCAASKTFTQLIWNKKRDSLTRSKWTEIEIDIVREWALEKVELSTRVHEKNPKNPPVIFRKIYVNKH
jgi:hypothetical protein